MKKILLILAIFIFATGSAYTATLTITNPNGGEELCLGKHYTIKWTSSGITTPLKLILWQNGNPVGDGHIVDDLPANTTQYDWVVGSYIGGTATAGTGYVIRVRTMDNGPYDESNAPFTIKHCIVAIDPNKYRLAQKIPCHFPGGPGCPGCPPEFDLGKLREQIGDPAEELKLVLLKNGRQILELGSFGKGRGLPGSVKGKLSEADLGLLKSGKGKFALGLLGADNKLRGTYALQVQ